MIFDKYWIKKKLLQTLIIVYNVSEKYCIQYHEWKYRPLRRHPKPSQGSKLYCDIVLYIVKLWYIELVVILGNYCDYLVITK